MGVDTMVTKNLDLKIAQARSGLEDAQFFVNQRATAKRKKEVKTRQNKLDNLLQERNKRSSTKAGSVSLTSPKSKVLTQKDLDKFFKNL